MKKSVNCVKFATNFKHDFIYWCWRRLKTDQGKLCFSVHHRIRLVDPTEVVLMPFLIESQF
ncbi:hypothetical protein A1359_21310 [Methylomonas lenta]|uniref:Uncharacterized protein n=1 Tax=Methylomonas lenta TaxID=980561 RepID=A0A177NQ47_9GAMM|nr:hypothetical protein A1359_21310 [Methylomonas lenta]